MRHPSGCTAQAGLLRACVGRMRAEEEEQDPSTHLHRATGAGRHGTGCEAWSRPLPEAWPASPRLSSPCPSRRQYIGMGGSTSARDAAVHCPGGREAGRQGCPAPYLHCLLVDVCRYVAPPQHRGTRAQGMAQHAPKCDAHRVLTRCQPAGANRKGGAAALSQAVTEEEPRGHEGLCLLLGVLYWYGTA